MGILILYSNFFIINKQGWHRHVGNHVTIFSYDMYGLKNKTEDYCDTKMEFLPLPDISAVCPVNYLRHMLQKFK